MSTNKIYFDEKFANDAIEYLDYGVDKITNEPKICNNIDCENCKFNFNGPIFRKRCTEKFQKWLAEDYEKPQPFLTYKEYCFLNMLRPAYKYMGRDRAGLFISVSNPIKLNETEKRWGYSGTTLRSFNVKFDFIGTNKYWSINDLKQLPIKEEPKEKCDLQEAKVEKQLLITTGEVIRINKTAGKTFYSFLPNENVVPILFRKTKTAIEKCSI